MNKYHPPDGCITIIHTYYALFSEKLQCQTICSKQKKKKTMCDQPIATNIINFSDSSCKLPKISPSITLQIGEHCPHYSLKITSDGHATTSPCQLTPFWAGKVFSEALFTITASPYCWSAAVSYDYMLDTRSPLTARPKKETRGNGARTNKRSASKPGKVRPHTANCLIWHSWQDSVQCFMACPQSRINKGGTTLRIDSWLNSATEPPTLRHPRPFKWTSYCAKYRSPTFFPSRWGWSQRLPTARRKIESLPNRCPV